MKKAFPILAVLTALLLFYAFYEAMWVAPTERTMGEVQRIFYYHVPSAWTAFVLFFVNLVASVDVSGSAKSESGCCSAGERRSRRNFLYRGFGYGADLGAAGVGHLVDLGPAVDVNAGVVADLRKLFDFAALLR